MSSIRSLAFLFVLIAVAVGAVWWFGDAAPSAPQPNAAAAAGPASPAALPAPSTPNDPQPANADPAREAAAPLLTEAAQPSDATRRAITGRVVDNRGTPVAGAIVTARPGFDAGSVDVDGVRAALDEARERARSSARTTNSDRPDRTVDDSASTAADGTFRLVTRVTAASLRVRVRAPGFTWLDQPVRVQSGAQDIDAGTLTLGSAAIVSGRVVDQNGSGIAGATVFREAAPRTARAPRTSGGERGPSGVRSMLLDSMSTTLFDDLANAFRETVVTAADGSFRLEHAEPGELSLHAHHDDHPAATSAPVQAAAGATIDSVTITMSPGARIEGRIAGLPANAGEVWVAAALRRQPPSSDTNGAADRFALSADEVADLTASIGAGERRVRVAADGTFVLRGLRPGATYRLSGSQPTATAFHRECTARRDATAPATGVELTWEPGIEVVLTVKAASTGGPIEELQVDHTFVGGNGLESLRALAPRDSQRQHFGGGRVVLANLRPRPGQRLKLTVEALGFERWEENAIEPPAQGTLDLGSIALQPCPIVRTTVRDKATGAPVADAVVRIELLDAAAAAEAETALARLAAGALRATSPPMRTDANGTLSLNAPSGGKPFKVIATHRQFATASSAPQRSTRRSSSTSSCC